MESLKELAELSIGAVLWGSVLLSSGFIAHGIKWLFMGGGISSPSPDCRHLHWRIHE